MSIRKIDKTASNFGSLCSSMEKIQRLTARAEGVLKLVAAKSTRPDAHPRRVRQLLDEIDARSAEARDFLTAYAEEVDADLEDPDLESPKS